MHKKHIQSIDSIEEVARKYKNHKSFTVAYKECIFIRDFLTEAEAKRGKNETTQR